MIHCLKETALATFIADSIVGILIDQSKEETGLTI